jgi:hypothetical protein
MRGTASADVDPSEPEGSCARWLHRHLRTFPRVQKCHGPPRRDSDPAQQAPAHVGVDTDDERALQLGECRLRGRRRAAVKLDERLAIEA